MKNPTLDHLYSQFADHLQVAQSYAEIPELSFILRSCRLKPYSHFFKQRNKKLALIRHWFDEHGNSLKIEQDKSICILYGDVSLPKDKIICTDLYYGLPLSKVIKMSKLLHICVGKDEDTHRDCFFLTFWGMDNYLRSYMYLQEEWQQVSPLWLGLDGLKWIAQNREIKHVQHLEKTNHMPIPCSSAQEWLSYLPLSPNLIQELKKDAELLVDALRLQA